MRARGVWTTANTEPPKHGERRCYQYGCRRPECVAANTRYTKRLRMDHNAGRRRTVDATGSRRRLLALGYIGWSRSEIARRLGGGTTKQMVSLWACSNRLILAENARAIARIYDELCMTPGPSRAAITWSRKAGGAPPLAWDDIDDPTEAPNLGAASDDEIDDVAIERAMAGQSVSLTRAERAEAIRRLAGQGRTDPEIATRLGIAERTVHRERVHYGIESRWAA